MDDLISRKAVISELGELLTICRESMPNENGKHYVTEEELCVFYARLSNISTVGAVPVVRCKDCKYWWSENELCDHPRHVDGNVCCHECNAEDYCSDGERRGSK